ncbi:MAG: KH domain-containing protein [Aphanocapsa lilacina HA4352-LM1]|nr:KH domain-containing protein [Aphanocapsa lilacina HA4352-LM1]
MHPRPLLRPTVISPEADKPPNYRELALFLIQPLLDTPEKLVISSETTLGGRKIRLRVAFAPTDKGRVFGRGGRTINAVRTVLECAARAAGQDVNLEVYE